MKTRIRNLFVLLAALSLAGCLEVKEEYFLNPDHSGKVVYEVVQPLMAGMMGGGKNVDMKQKAKDEALKIIEDSKGVTVWKDVSYELNDAGKLHFKGTAYFDDFAKVEIKGGDDKNRAVLQQTKAGMQLRFQAEKKAAKTKLTPAQIKKRAAAKKAQFQQQRMMMSMMLNGLKIESIYHFPGKVQDAKIYRKTDGNTVKLVLEGAKMLQAIDELAKDDAWWEKQVVAGAGEPPMDDLMQKMFGSPDTPQVTAKSPLKPLFNYKAEVAQAKKDYPAMRQKLGFPKPVEAVPMAAGGGLKNIRVGGVRLIREVDEKNQVRPFNWTKGYTLAIIAELPGATLLVKDAKLTKALADNGEDLLPEREWDRRISFPKLSKNKAVVILEAKMNPPSPQVRGIKELAGELTYMSSAGLKKVDLGTVSLTAGSKGKDLGAEVKSVKDSKWRKGHQEIKSSSEINMNN